MTDYLLDTNILLRSSDPSSSDHHLAADSISRILSQGDECVITAQVLIEFWVVATRPIPVNGLGWDADQTQRRVTQLLTEFQLLRENQAIFENWFDLIKTHRILGKRTHDLRLIAVMQAYNITHLLTLNPRDFPLIPGIAIVHPQNLLNP